MTTSATVPPQAPRAADPKRSIVRRTTSWLRSQAPVILMVCAAVVPSIAAIPSGSELGLLELELGRTAEALANLERRYEDGDRSPSTLAALSAARVRGGNPRGAIAILEPLLETRGSDPGLLKVLAGHYRAVGDDTRELAMLEKIVSQKPTEDLLQSMARLYGKLDRYDDQRRVLTRLLERPNASPTSYVELAKAEAKQGRPLDGADVLAKLRGTRPKMLETGFISLEMTLRIQGNQLQQAVELGNSWLEGRRATPQNIASIASVLSVSGHPDVAAGMLAPFVEKMRHPALELALFQAEVDTGKGQAVFEKIERRAAQPGAVLSPDLARFRIRLAAFVGTLSQVVAAAEAAGPALVPQDLLPAVVVAARRTGRMTLVEELHKFVSSPESGVPAVVAAQTFLAFGDRTSALAAATQAAEIAAVDGDTAIKLAAVEHHLLRTGRALAILRKTFGTAASPRAEGFAGDDAVPSNELDDLARVYIAVGAAVEGEAVLAAARRLAPSAAADQAWALVATAARRDDAVAAWLAQVDDLPSDFLRQVTFLAAGRSSKVAVMTASRLQRDSKRVEDRVLLAEVQALVGVPISALRPAEMRPAAMR